MPKLSISKLYSGTSSQPAYNRKQGTVEDASNIRFDVSSGAVKRNALEFVADLLEEAQGDDFDATSVYWISIQDAIIAIIQDGIYAWDLEGTPLTVTDSHDGTTYGYNDYLHTFDPNELDHTVQFDTAILLNRAVSPGAGATYTWDECANIILNGDPTDDTDVPSITDQGNKDDYSDLLDLSPTDGDLWYCASDYQLDPAGNYLYLDTAINDEDSDNIFPKHGQWYRISSGQSDGQANGKYDPDEMPHRLVYDASAGTVTFSECPWMPRLSGNGVTNPLHPWARDYLRAVEFHKGRLFLFGNETITSSRSGDFFNLFADNVNDSVESDPINIDVSQPELGQLNRAVSLGSVLFLTAEKGQLQFTSGENQLTNINGRTVQIGAVQSDDTIEPDASNGMVCLIDKEAFVHAWRYSDPVNGATYVGNLNMHHKKLFQSANPTSLYLFKDTLYIPTDADEVELFDIYQTANEWIQSAWGTHDYSAEVHHVYLNGEYIYYITEDDTGYSLQKYRHYYAQPPSNYSYYPCLDRMELVSGSYDADTGLTTFSHSGRDASLTTSRVVTADDDGSQHVFLVPSSVDDEDFTVKGDWSDLDHYIGFTFDASITLTDLWLNASTSRPMLNSLSVFYFDSTDFELQWSLDRSGVTRTKSWQAPKVGASLVDGLSIDTGYTKVLCLGDPRRLAVTISSDSPGTFCINALEYNLKAKGY